MGRRDERRKPADDQDDAEEMRRYLRGLERSISGKSTRRDTEIERELEELRKEARRDSDSE